MMKWIPFGFSLLKQPRQDYWVDAPLTIGNILSELQHQHRTLALQFEGHHQLYSTHLLEVDPEHHFFLLEGISQPSGHKQLLAQDFFTLKARLNGIRIEIPSNRAIEASTDYAAALYKIPFPKGLIYLQRRKLKRHKIPPCYATSVTVPLQDEALQATLVDLSMGGCRLELTGDLLTRLEEVPTLLGCTTTLPETAGTLRFDANVCFARYNRFSNTTVCGLQFATLHDDSRLHLSVFIQQLRLPRRRKPCQQPTRADIRAHEPRLWLNTRRAPCEVQPDNGLREYLASYLRQQEIRQHVDQLLDAAQLHDDLIILMRNTFNAVRRNEPVPLEALEQHATRLVQTLLAKRDDLLCMDRVRAQCDYHYEHAVGISILLTHFGHALGLKQETLRQLALGGLLLDIGKARLPLSLLEKRERLSQEELETIRLHVQHGHCLLNELGIDSPIIRAIVEQHHERYDGLGYPQRLLGEEISLYGRMAAIVDAYDAMISARNHQSAIPPTLALRKLAQEEGGQFDRTLVYRFIRCMGIFPVGSYIRLRDHSLAVVRRLNQALLPIEILITEEEGHTLLHPKKLSLEHLTWHNVHHLVGPAGDCDELHLSPHLLRQTMLEELGA